LNYATEVSNETGMSACDVPPFTLKETTPPDITPPIIVPPPNITAECALSPATNGTIVASLGEVIASDDSDVAVTVYNDAPLQSSFPLGHSIVSYWATDSAGNQTTVQQDVRIEDTRPPYYEGSGLPNIVANATNVNGTLVSLSPPAFSDTCNRPTEINVWTDTDLTAFPMGDTTVIWKAMDTSGNLSTIPQLVTVKSQRLTCMGFLSPMNRGPVKVRNSRVLPLKASLFHADGSPVTDAELFKPPVINVSFVSSKVTSAIDVTNEALSAGMGAEGNQFELNDDGNWQYNLATINYSTKGKYRLSIESGDPIEYEIDPKCQGMYVKE